MQLHSLTGHGDLSLQSPFCFLLIIIKVGQPRLTHVWNTGGNTGKDYWSIQQLSCPVLREEHLGVESLTSLCLVNERLVSEGKLGRLLS